MTKQPLMFLDVKKLHGLERWIRSKRQCWWTDSKIICYRYWSASDKLQNKLEQEQYIVWSVWYSTAYFSRWLSYFPKLSVWSSTRGYYWVKTITRISHDCYIWVHYAYGIKKCHKGRLRYATRWRTLTLLQNGVNVLWSVNKPDPATPTVAAPAPMYLAAWSMSFCVTLVWNSRSCNQTTRSHHSLPYTEGNIPVIVLIQYLLGQFYMPSSDIQFVMGIWIFFTTERYLDLLIHLTSLFWSNCPVAQIRLNFKISCRPVAQIRLNFKIPFNP